MSDFVRKPLLQQLNKENPITRIEVLESKNNVKTSAIINSISELSSNMGEITNGKFNFYNPNTGQLVGYLSSVPLPGYPSYYFVMTDSAGNVQFSVDPSTSGGTTMGNGNVTIAENGITIANNIPSYIFKDVAGNSDTIYLNATTGNALEIKNNATSGDINIKTSSTDGSIILYSVGIGGDIKQIITLTDASTPYIKWWENPSELNTAYLEINAGVTSTNVRIGAGVNIRATKDGTETVFNEDSYDIDFRIEGATNANLFALNAGMDTIGIGKAATSDYILDIDGDVNLATGHVVKINGTTVLSGTVTGVTNGDTHNHVGGDGAVLPFLFPMATYINLNPITASSQSPYGGTVEASLSFVNWSMGFYTAGAAHDNSNYYTFTLKLRQGAAASDVTIATLNTKTLTSNNGVVFSTTTFSPTGVTGTGYLYIISTKTGTPADTYVLAPALRCTLT